jgi:hypothetical protein
MPETAIYPSTPTISQTAGSRSINAGSHLGWRGVLLINPDISVLSSKSSLLSKSNYSVTPAFSHAELFILRETKAIALAILSGSLGQQLLPAIAETVRRQWPLARILILGPPQSVLEDHLYDEEINDSLTPKQLLDELERLYKGSWNQRTNTLDWNSAWGAMGVSRPSLSESDPSKVAPVALADKVQSHEIPADFKSRTNEILSNRQAMMRSHNASLPTYI